MNKIYFIKTFFLVILFTIYYKSAAQEVSYNDNYLISILYAGNCNNVIIQDKFVDSICHKYNIQHFYYFINIDHSEIEEFSSNIFGVQFKKNQILDTKIVSQLLLDTYKMTNRLLFISNKRVIKNIEITNFEEINIINFNSNTEIKRNEFFQDSKPIFRTDSFELKYEKKIKIDSLIRFNYRCVIKKNDTTLFILEPLFKKYLYKTSAINGQIIQKIPLEKCLVNYDSILFCIYKNQIAKYPSIKDSLVKYSKILNHKIKSNYYNLAIFEKTLFVSSDIGIVVLNAYSKPIVLNYRIIYKFDFNLNLIEFYADPFISYRNFFVDFTYLDLFDAKNIQMRLMSFANSKEKVLRSIYCRLISKEHLIYKFGRDSVVIPSRFAMEFNSNQTTHQQNISDTSNPAWLLDPYPFIYYPKDSIFFNFLTNKIDSSTTISFKSSILTQRLLKIDKFDSIIKLVYMFNDFSYCIELDVKNKNLISITPLGPLQKLSLEPIFDETGKLILFPSNNSKNGNYIYFK